MVLHEAESQCLKNERCVSHCGMQCRTECGLQVDDTNIQVVKHCRRHVQCEQHHGDVSECRYPDCDDDTSDETHCFLDCERECSIEFLDQSQDDVCSERCSSNCNALTQSGSDDQDEYLSLSPKDLPECIKFCSISSHCLGKDEIYEYRMSTNSAEVVNLEGGGLDENDGNWEYASSSERNRISIALNDEESEEAMKYQVYKDAVENDDRLFKGTGDDMFSASDVLSALGLSEGMGDMSEDEIMQLIQQMMMGGGMGYGEEGYGYEYGGGFEDGYGGAGYGGSAYEGDGYEDDFGE